jgi:dTDP-3,4-didehydro-2,6-dideoxy-alpha-D-glucose 3-reductase
MGRGLEVVASCLAYDDETGVDLYGESMLRNDRGQVAQVAYGFDYHYQCCLELLGTKGKFTTGRLFTAPPGLATTMTVESADGARDVVLEPDNAYENMVALFSSELQAGSYERHWRDGLDQARLLEDVRQLGNAGSKT